MVADRAEQGGADAQEMLGDMYYFGQGVPQDYAKAAHWIRKAAEQGDADGQFMLGYMYTEGEGLPQDVVQAYAWYNLAAAAVHEDAREERDELL